MKAQRKSNDKWSKELLETSSYRKAGVEGTTMLSMWQFDQKLWKLSEEVLYCRAMSIGIARVIKKHMLWTADFVKERGAKRDLDPSPKEVSEGTYQAVKAGENMPWYMLWQELEKQEMMYQVAANQGKAVCIATFKNRCL